jgi:chorismate dehydratase
LDSVHAKFARPRVCAVSYLNTAPLVYGLVDGPQRGAVDLTFAVPSMCSERVVSGVADVGLLPVIEMARHGYGFVPGLGIGCRGPVRSILLVSGGRPFDRLRTLAADTGSRTSVELARIVLKEKHAAEPALVPMAPDLSRMLEFADAALLIGDAALALDPTELGLPVLDLGEEWVDLTGLPMVFAVWSGRPRALSPKLESLLHASCRAGLENLDSIIEKESDHRGFPHHLVQQYLTRNIQVLLEERDMEGMRTFLRLAAALEPQPAVESPRVEAKVHP